MTQFVSLTRIRWIVDYRVDNAIHWRLKHKTGSLRVVPHFSRVSETRARENHPTREKAIRGGEREISTRQGTGKNIRVLTLS